MNYKKADRISEQVGERSDCTVKAIAIACDKPYRMVHAMLKAEGRRDRCGCYRPQQEAVINKLGYKMVRVGYPGGTVSTLTQKLPSKGRFMAYVRGHVLAVQNGKIEDWTEGRRHRIIDVYKIERIERKPRHKHSKA